MKRTFMLTALLCLAAWAAEDAAGAPQSNASHKPQAASYGAEAITIPQMLSYQGKLTDTFGLPVADTLYAIRFRLYAQPTGGTQFWEENQDVRTTGGLFSTLLGSVTPISSVPDAGAAYLGMAVAGGNEMTPRLRIASAAYAYLTARSANADLLQGKDTTALDSRYVNEGQTSSVTSAMITNGAVANADIANTAVTTAKLADTAVTLSKIAQAGASTGQVVKWTGSSWAPRNDSVGGGGGVPDSVPGSFAVTTDLRVYGKGRIGPGNSNAGNAAFVAGEGNTASANYSSVSGGADNTASGIYTHIGGGGESRAAGDYSTVGGGVANYASGGKSTVSGGSDNEAYGLYAAVGGGLANLAGGAAADTGAVVAGGWGNFAVAPFATTGGGKGDTASGPYATVAGGWHNVAGGGISTVGGGSVNKSSGSYATVAGGTNNRASGDQASIGGGGINEASEYAATVGGGNNNDATGQYSTVGGGQANLAAGSNATVGGGAANAASGRYGTVAGGTGNIAGDAASDTAATVAGGYDNVATGIFATVGGGQYDTAAGDWTTASGGYSNRATQDWAAVGGGNNNLASSYYATVAGGQDNLASGSHAGTGGGLRNVASGGFATVPGGVDNKATRYASFAAGKRASALHAGSFVWGDSSTFTSESVYTTGNNQWRVRARGGVWFYSNLAKTTGAYLAPGSNSWESACDSMTKEDFRPVDRKALLDKIAGLRVRDYKMKDQDDGTRHIGPVAQDFHAAFGVGEDNTHINMADADGVLLAAVQALYERDEAQQLRIAQLEAELARMKK